MKKIKIFSLFLALATVFGCTDLDENPVGVLAPEGFFKTPKDVEAAIFGAYGRMASESYYGRKLSLSLQLLGDMSDIGNRGTPARRVQINDFNADSYNGMVTAFWPRSYEIISAANAAINGAEIISASDEEKAELEAEAKFVRAYVYYHLVRLFGDIPYIDYSVSDPEAVKTLSKTSAAQVYEGILADLEFGKQNLPDQHPQNVRTRPSKGTAYTMSASVNLTLGNWQAAYDDAKWVIDNAATLEYGLVADYQDLFDATKQDGIEEHIFALDFIGQRAGAGSENDDLMGPLTGIRGSAKQGWGVSVPAQAVYDNWDDRDYRKSVAFEDSAYVNDTLVPYTEFTNEKRPHIAKWTRFPGNSDLNTRYTDHNYVCFRYAEVLLIAAEALNEVNGGPNTEAEGYINQIRERARNWAGTTTDFPADVTSGLSKDDFLDLVLDERRLELSFEFKRWYDIKRRQLGDEVFKGANSLEPHDNFNANMHYLLPLPQDELDRNPNLLPQNSGY